MYAALQIWMELEDLHPYAGRRLTMVRVMEFWKLARTADVLNSY